MLIDWFTVAAQGVNFLVLVYLLKRFLYGPIIRAMDAREAKIAAQLQEAQGKKDQAQEEIELYQEKNRELDARREALLAQIKEEVEARRKELMNETRDQVDAVRAGWYESMEREKETFLQDLRQRAGKHTCAIVRRALKDLANVDLEHHITRVFIERLRNLDDHELQTLSESVGKSGGRIKVLSTFEIPREMTQEVVSALSSVTGGSADLQFEVSPDVLCGIELKSHGWKIAWSVADYMGGLEQSLLAALEATGEKKRIKTGRT
jgi:F-type H+-transporting ATPase subunit b